MARHSGPGQRERIAAILMGGLGITQVVAMPLVAPLIAGAFQMTGSDSGLVGLANLLGTALGSLIVTVWMKRLPLRLTAMLSALLACGAQLWVPFMPGFHAAVLMETLGGAGAGVLLALSAAIIGASANPDRGFAFILTLQAIVAVVVLLAIPALGEPSSLLPAAAFIAGVQALLIPVSFALRRPPITGGSRKLSDKGGSALHPAVLMKACAYFVFSAAVGVLWVFSGVLGSIAGLADGPVGQALAVGNIAAIAGSLLAALITSRFGRIAPVLAVCLMLGLSVLLFTNEMTVGEFYVASGLFLFAWGGGLPFLMGVVAETDPTERVTALLPVLAFAGMGVGPALVGFAPAGWDLFHQVAIATLALTILAFVLFVAAQLRWPSPLASDPSEMTP